MTWQTRKERKKKCMKGKLRLLRGYKLMDWNTEEGKWRQTKPNRRHYKKKLGMERKTINEQR